MTPTKDALLALDKLRIIPSDNGYPGLIAYPITGTQEIVVMGSGEEAMRVLEEAVREYQAPTAVM